MSHSDEDEQYEVAVVFHMIDDGTESGVEAYVGGNKRFHVHYGTDTGKACLSDRKTMTVYDTASTDDACQLASNIVGDELMDWKGRRFS